MFALKYHTHSCPDKKRTRRMISPALVLPETLRKPGATGDKRILILPVK